MDSNPAHYGIRTKQYKLIYYYGKPLDAKGALKEETPMGYELYNMINDPLEMHNLYENEQYNTVSVELKAKLATVKVELKDDDDLMKDDI